LRATTQIRITTPACAPVLHLRALAKLDLDSRVQLALLVDEAERR